MTEVGDFGIAALDLTPWDGPWMNRQQIVSRLASHYPAIYSTGLLHLWQRREADFASFPCLPRVDIRGNVALDVPGRLCLRWHGLAFYDRCLVAWHVKRLVGILRTRGARRFIAYVFHPAYGRYAQRAHFDRIVYHLYDFYEKTPGWNEELDCSHRKLMEDADAVIASSHETGRALEVRFGRRVEVVTNGVDYEAFAVGAGREPSALQGIPRPRIGHVGRLNRKIDFRLVSDLARSRPDWQFVLVGPIGSLDDRATAGLARCREQGNVWFVDQQPPGNLPAFMHHMDVNAMFYATSDELWSNWVFPLKLHEYLAVGRPVVATALPSLLDFRAVVALPKTEGQWLTALDQAIRHGGVGTSGQRRAIARDNAWDSKVSRIRGLIDATAP